MPLLPVIARIDGKVFHNFTKGMERPYDARFRKCMTETVKQLVKDTGACLGYTQSDEITLAWNSTSLQSKIWFDGRVMKMTSHLAAKTTIIFYRLVLDIMPEYAYRCPTFDARVWNVPNLTEGANSFLWREQDATKNSISMAARCLYTHKELLNKSDSEKHEMLYRKGVNWNNYSSEFKRGVYVQRREIDKEFTISEITNLPEKHKARTVPDVTYKRSVVNIIDMPPFGTVKNREDVVFKAAAPIT